MRIIILLLLLFWRGVAALSVQAQCLALADLLAIGAEPTALTTPALVTPYLTFEWAVNGPSATSREIFWTLPASDNGPVPAARLQLRAQRPGQDVVLKTTQAACVRQLRSELKSRKLPAQPVTCPSCEAERFQGPDFEATIYSQMKGDYPFVVVVHQVPAVASAAPTTTAAGSAAPAVPAVDVATAAKAIADPLYTVLDVRTPEEYAAGHLLRAQNLNFQAIDFGQQLSKLNPKGRYVLYCATGIRSGKAAALLQQRGIANVLNAGGYLELKAAGAK